MKKLAIFALATAAIAAAAPAQAVVIGTADSSNSYPFGAFGAPYFQQIYSASAFGGPITISQLTFYTTQSPTTVTPLNDTFTLFLATSAEAIAPFDTTNIPFGDLASYTQVFSGKVTVSAGKLTINLATPFTYNPTAGNLLLTVRDFDYGSGGNLFLDTDKNVGVMNIRLSSFGYDYNLGLVTGFNESVAAVPEPATWGMMIAGFGIAGGTLRYRRRATRVPFA